MMVEKNITKTDLAKKIGVSKAYITKVLRGEANFTVETMVKFSMALGCVIEDIRFLNTQTDWATFSSQKSSSILATKVVSLHEDHSVVNNVGKLTELLK